MEENVFELVKKLNLSLEYRQDELMEQYMYIIQEGGKNIKFFKIDEVLKFLTTKEAFNE